MKPEKARTWVEINREALKKNFESLSKCLQPDVLKMAVVKSNAYGHGMVECARIFKESGADFLGVDSFEEALELREGGLSSPILVLGYTPVHYFNQASVQGISLTISNLESLKDAHILNTFLKIHIKVDTGLHRQGFQDSDLKLVISLLKKSPHLLIEGLYTHLSSAETPKHIKHTKNQINKLGDWISEFEKLGSRPIIHASASAAGILHKDMQFGMVRFGISLYGLWPSEETKTRAGKTKLIPALSWKAVVSETKKVNRGEPVGYDLTEKLKRDSVLAIIPIGYWHGYPRSLSSVGEVVLKGKRAKVIGRVSMDMIVVDVTGISGVRQGTEVLLIGDKDGVFAEDVAKRAKTINYEVVTRINPIIERVFS
jgi:alanine racemase